jgi:hypothetical protein
MTPQHTGDPVFADRTGRRHRLFTLAGTAGGLALAAAVLVLLAAFTGAGPATLPGWDDATAPAPRRSAAAAPAPRSTSERPPAAPTSTSRPAARASAARASVTPNPSAAATVASPTPTVKGKGRDHRRVPTHTPSARPSRKP